MKAGDQVIPAGFKNKSRPGTIKMMCGNIAVVTWIMGSGWEHVAKMKINEIERV